VHYFIQTGVKPGSLDTTFVIADSVFNSAMLVTEVMSDMAKFQNAARTAYGRATCDKAKNDKKINKKASAKYGARHFTSMILVQREVPLFILDFKPSRRSECCVLASGLFIGVCNLSANVSKPSLCSIFIGE
jgi:hypothetical protein